jgi:hypothetical protein
MTGLLRQSDRRVVGIWHLDFFDTAVGGCCDDGQARNAGRLLELEVRALS